MQVACPHCSRVLEYTGDPPVFCAYCGKSLAGMATSTADLIAQQATRPFTGQIAESTAPALTNLGPYRIVRRIGGGGMGSVFEAEEPATGQHVAIKVIAPEFARTPVAVERFRQEGRLASLISHPRCVFVLTAEEEAGRPYIVMELMPGTNLQEVVERDGPLPIQDAVRKILDVIEGLQEAHRLGVIHRDVKPSNCFLLDDGRVKIGDFGLSKSLVNSVDLTKTGTFLGTLLYASPEQIKGERLDVRTDVYSVAATLYYLLSGQAPFQGKDPAATLARTISDPPTPLRSLRPEVSPALNKVILRGLERNPDRRYRNLEEFRAALLRFVPRSLSIGAMGLRTVAIIIDGLPYIVLNLLLVAFFPSDKLLTTSVTNLVTLAYFTIFEGIWGATPGKWLMKLRVCGIGSSDSPGIWRALLRTLAYYVITTLTLDLTDLVSQEDEVGWHLLGIVSIPLGILLLVSTMRARNGYRGLHEWISGTRVVRLPWPKKAEVFQSRRPRGILEVLAQADDLPPTIGPFAVLGLISDVQGQRRLLAEDASLGRKVLMQCRAGAAVAVEAARRNLNRPTRLRWLSGGTQGQLVWDAFLAPTGCSLTELVDPDQPMSWRSFRGLLEQLSDELAAACADGTLPTTLTLDQIWVQPNGRLQLLDEPLEPPTGEHYPLSLADPHERSLHCLREAAELALEGKVRSNQASLRPIRAAVPEHAGAILDRLLGRFDPYREVGELQADLAATHDRPAEVNRTLRAAHLVLLGLALQLPLGMMFAMSYLLAGTDVLLRPQQELRGEAGSIAAMAMVVGVLIWLIFWPSLWVIWALALRGGVTMRMMSLTLVADNGRPASHLRCAWRALLVWFPMLALLITAISWKAANPEVHVLPMVLVWAAGVYLVACVIMALCMPVRSLHDRLAGTYLVPK